MIKNKKIIKKLFEEAINDKFTVEMELEPLEVIRAGEKKQKLVEYDGYFCTFAKTTLEGCKAIRMIFALREKTKKVYNVGRITEVVENLEDIFVYIDKCEITNADNFIYLDAVKKL